MLSVEMLPPEQINDDPRPQELPLTTEAKSLFVQFVNENGAEQADLGGELAATWSKLEGYAARFALVHQLIRWANGECAAEHIDAESMTAGIALTRWFGKEARRVHATFAETDEERERRELTEWIQRRGGRTNVREMMLHLSLYRTSDPARKDLQDLVTAGVGRWDQVATAGRTREDFVLLELAHQHNLENPLEEETSVDVDEPINEIGALYLKDSELSSLMEWH